MSVVKTLEISTVKRAQLIDITPMVADMVAESGIREGLAHIFVPHTTAAVTINEGADPAVAQDLLAALAGLAPDKGDYSHLEGNSDAHIKASLLGSSQSVPVSGGKLLLGTWQSVFFCEFDGPRRRKALIKLLG